MVNRSGHFQQLFRAAVLASVLGITGLLSAQVSFQSVEVEGHMVSPRTLFQASLGNTGAAMRAVIIGEIRTRAGDAVILFRTAPFLVQQGATIIAASSVEMTTFTYGAGEAARAARQFQRLPAGHYNWCMRLLTTAGEQQDEYCDALDEEEDLFLDLVQPWDGDTIDEVRPALQWTLSGSGPSMTDADVRIVLVPAQVEQAAQAIASERPLFMVPHVKEKVMPYPFGVPDLERGKCYAWQAERLEDARVLDRSEPWKFCVRKEQLPEGNKFVLLGRQVPGTVYEAVDKKIHFRYDEAYASSHLDCAIYDKDRRRIDPHVQVDQKASSGTVQVDARSIGVNLYELDLQPYGLVTGYYQLVVRNEKGMHYELDFHVTP